MERHSRPAGFDALAALQERFRSGKAVPMASEIPWFERVREALTYAETWHDVDDELSYAERMLGDSRLWEDASPGVRVTFLSLLVARVRHVHSVADVPPERFAAFMRLAQNRIDALGIGAVNGIAPKGVARRGAQWEEQSDIFRQRTRVAVGPLFLRAFVQRPRASQPDLIAREPDQPRPNISRKKDAPPTPPKRERILDDWSWWGWTSGKRVLMVGGEGKSTDVERIKDAFRMDELIWPPTAHRSRYLVQLPEMIRAGRVDLVIILPWSRHAVNLAIEPIIDSTSTPKVRVDVGYGIDAIRRSIERCLAPRPLS